MLRRDYIQRMIEEFARVVGRAMGMKGSGRDEEAVAELREAYRTWFGLDADTFGEQDAPAFLHRICAEQEMPNEKLEALAFGLKAEWELLSPADPQSADRREKALALFLYLEEKDRSNFSFTRKAAIRQLENGNN